MHVQSYNERDMRREIARRKRVREQFQCAPSMSMGLSLYRESGSGAGPTYPTSGLYLGLIADDANFTLSLGKISGWAGVGTSGLSAVQASAPLQPSPGTGINGRKSVTFAGSQIMTVAGVALGVFDIYVILKTSTANCMVFERSVNTVVNSGEWLYTGSPGQYARRAALACGRSPTSSPWIANGVASVVRVGHDGTNAGVVFQRDGSNIASTNFASDNVGTSTVTDTLHIGARNAPALGFVGDIGAILIYNSAPDSTRAAQILAYSKSVWGTP